jgi:hypothetical protein
MMFMNEPRVRLYVKSVKTVAGTEEIEREIFGRSLSHSGCVKVEGSVSDGTFRLRQFGIIPEPKYDFVLSENQQATVEMVQKVASRHGLKLEVIDVTKEDVLHRTIQREFVGIRVFPTLTTSSGNKIEGNITEKEVESILSRINTFRHSFQH